ncbi:hypothetical protein, partial [Mycobacterium sp. 1165196.3]|uniref:hypothetical protein n=1 Tax=Mycobacterium sp. 1165196.3 TaxID=1834071 RepID=UPI000A8FB787
FVAHVAATVDMLRRTTPLRLFWARDYSDYHPEEPGGSAAPRTNTFHHPEKLLRDGDDDEDASPGSE